MTRTAFDELVRHAPGATTGIDNLFPDLSTRPTKRRVRRPAILAAATAAARMAGRRTRRLVGRVDRSGNRLSMPVVAPGAWRTSSSKAVRVMTDPQRQWRIREWARPERVGEHFVTQGLAQASRAIRALGRCRRTGRELD